MSEENAEVVVEAVEPAEAVVETPIEDKRLDTPEAVVDAPVETPEVTEEAKKQQATQDIINKKHFEAKQAERERDAALARANKLEAAERQRQAATIDKIPPIPEEFDENFNQKMAARDAAIQKRADYIAAQNLQRQQQQYNQQQAQQRQSDELNTTSQAYNVKSVELGIKPEELKAAGAIVSQYGLSNELVVHILKDSDGPLITKHLAANPQEGLALAAMSPYEVGTYLDGVRSKVNALRPKQSKTPSPADTLQGGAPDLDNRPLIANAKFE